MGTRIFVGGQNREIVKPCTFLVHNPWGSVEGDAEQLMSAGEIMKQEEDKLINIYHKVTNNEKAILDILMKQDTPMSEEKALELGFATKVTGTQVVAVAYLPKKSTSVPKEKQTIEMDNKDAKKAKGALASLLAWALGEEVKPEPKGMMVTDSNGVMLELWNPDQSPATEVKAGLMVTMDGDPAPDGSYNIGDQAVTITVMGGVVTDVQPIQAAAPDPLLAKIEALEKENADLKAKNIESEKNAKEVMEKIDNLTGIMAKLKGTHVPANGQTKFGEKTPVDKNKIDWAQIKEDKRKQQTK
jgi:hypothetical protein